MSIIKKGQNTKETHEWLDLSKESKYFTVKGQTRICYSEASELPELHYEEVWDCELEYYVSDKKVDWKGFRKLYNQLFGEGSFEQFEEEIVEEFNQVASEHHCEKYKTIKSLSMVEADKYMNRLIDEGLINKKTAVCHKTNKKYLYTSSYLAKEICRHNEVYAIQRLKVPYTHQENDNIPNEHQVVVLHEYTNI